MQRPGRGGEAGSLGVQLRGAGAQAAAVRLDRRLGVLGQAWRSSSEAKLTAGLTDSSTRELWRGAAGDSAPKTS